MVGVSLQHLLGSFSDPLPVYLRPNKVLGSGLSTDTKEFLGW